MYGLAWETSQCHLAWEVTSVSSEHGRRGCACSGILCACGASAKMQSLKPTASRGSVSGFSPMTWKNTGWFSFFCKSSWGEPHFSVVVLFEDGRRAGKALFKAGRTGSQR